MKKETLLLFVLTLLSVVTASAQSVDGIYYNFDTSTKQAKVASNSQKYTGSVTIPATVTYNDVTYSVTSIGNYAFYNCTGLTSVTIPNSVTSIEECAFYQCSDLTSVTIGNSVTSIGNHAFYGCEGLTSVTIPNGVTSIGNSAFSGCKGLTSVTIPNSVTEIGESAFYSCSHLTEVTIPDGVTSIGSGAFYNCFYLTSVTIGNGVTSIGNYAFYQCSDLTSVTIGNSVTSIGEYAFYHCYDLTSVTIPSSVTTIETYAFSGCNSLTAVHITDLEAWCKIIFSDSYSNPLSFAKHLYLDGKEIKDLVIPSSMTSIGDYAFYGCEGLTSVTIHNNVTEIGKNAFYSCKGLTDVYCYAENVPNTDSDAFYYNMSSVTLHVPEGSLNNYKTTSPWSKFGTIKGIVFEIDGIYYGLNNSKKQAVVTSDDKKYTGSVTIPSAVTYDGVTYSVTSIGDGAFSDCSDLTSVTIPSSVTSIGEKAFYYCSALTSVTIPNSVTTIGKNAFNNCFGLTSLIIPNSVTSIGEYAFLGCSNLKKVELRSNAIASETYTSNSNIKNIFGEQVTEYVIGDNVASIGDYAFFDCPLTSVTLGRGITSIGNYAFANYPELKDFYCYAEYAPTISRNAFQNSYVDYVTLHVPEASLEDYKAAATWKSFGEIVAIGDDPGVKKCAAPTITVADGKIILSCETEGAEFDYVITTPHVKTSDGNVSISDKLLITVIATSDGYQPSDEVTQEIDKSLLQGKKGDVNEDGTVNGTDIQEVINIIVGSE